MFAVGCIGAELYSQEPLFAGRDELDQLRRMFAVMRTGESPVVTPVVPKTRIRCRRFFNVKLPPDATRDRPAKRVAKWLRDPAYLVQLAEAPRGRWTL